jgi:RNA polymerase sigma factor (sigma-70 family)
MTPDLDLLREYVHNRSESAFAELVRRHADWVYAIAKRKVREDQLAQDVAQAVFIVLARKAPRLLARRWNVRLTGWLYHVVRLTASNALRELSRRRRHEQAAAAQRAETSEPEQAVDWERLLPMVDASLADLRGADREAVLLRFYRQQTFTDVAGVLGVSEEAARKRVARAIDRLRRIVRKRGATDLTSAALATGLFASAAPSSNAVAGIVAGATASSVAPSLLAKTVLHALFLKQAATAVVAAAMVLLVAGGAGVLVQLADAPSSQQAQAAVAASATPATQPTIDPVAQQRMNELYVSFLALSSASWEMEYTQPEHPPHFWGPRRTATVMFRRPNLCVVKSNDVRGDFWAMSDGKEMAWIKTAFRSERGRGGWTVPDPAAKTYLRMPVPPGDDAIKRVFEEGHSDGFDYFRWMCARVEPLEFDEADHAKLVSLAQGAPGQVDGVATETVVATLYRAFADPKYEGTFVITYEIGRDDHFIRRVSQSFSRADGKELPRTRVGTYTQVRLNVELPDETFAIAPPAALQPETPRYNYDPRVVAIGAAPPPIETVDVAGKQVSLNDYRGKVLLLNFVSPISELHPPQRGPRMLNETSKLIGLYERYRERGLDILTIGTNRPGDKRYREQELKQLAEALDLPWRVAYDAGRMVADAYGIERGMTLGIGRDGRVFLLDDDALLDRRLTRALAEPKGPATGPGN